MILEKLNKLGTDYRIKFTRSDGTGGEVRVYSYSRIQRVGGSDVWIKQPAVINVPATGDIQNKDAALYAEALTKAIDVVNKLDNDIEPVKSPPSVEI